MFKNEFATLCSAGRAKADFLEKNKVVVDDIQLSEKNKVIKRKGEKT